MFFLLVLLLLSGCVAQSIKPEQALQIKKIGVISMLPVDLRYEKIGITVFNNEQLVKPVGDKFNNAALNEIQKQLNTKEITILSLPKEASDRFYSHSIVMSSATERIQSELAALAKKNNLDTILIISEVFDQDQGRRGVEVFFSAGFGSIRSVTLKPSIAIHVVSHEGKAIAAVGSNIKGKAVSPSVNNEWKYELAQNVSDSEHLRLLDEMALLISSEIKDMATKLGLI